MDFLQVLISGLALGCIYGLIALGFVMIYKATEAINFAQGELMMLGAFLGLGLMEVAALPWPAALAAAVLLAFAGGMAIERLAIRPVLGQPQFAVVMLTIGLGYMFRGAMTMIPYWGTETHALQSPVSGQVLRSGGLSVSFDQLLVMATTAALCLALFALFRFTRVGIAMQAVSQNQMAAYLMGIPVRRLNGFVWGVSAAVACIAGILLAPLTFVHVNMGIIGLKAFPAAVIGGFGSMPGAIVGGLIIGVAEALAGFYLPEGVKDVVPYAVVLIMLVVKPTGLFGDAARRRV